MTTTGWVVLGAVVLILVACAIQSALTRAAARRAIAKAQADYEDALFALEENPADSRYRIGALEKGRYFADIAREQAGDKGRAIFDEVALSNDLNARTGSATGDSTPVPQDKWACPDCAEMVKQAARKCRFCGCVFAESGVGSHY